MQLHSFKCFSSVINLEMKTIMHMLVHCDTVNKLLSLSCLSLCLYMYSLFKIMT